VFVLSDLDLGMNQWMCKPFQYPAAPMDRGKVLWEKDLEELKGSWGRYLDKDGDGIPYRTVPGNKHPMSSYFLRGTGHDENARYSEEAPVWERNMDRIKKKYVTARQHVPAPILQSVKGAQAGILAFGSSEAAIQEARVLLEKDQGLKTDFMRIRAVPFTDQVRAFIETHDQTYVVELNRDGQMFSLLAVAYPDLAPKLVQVACNDGLPATAKWVRDTIVDRMGQIRPGAKPAAKPKAKKTASRKKEVRPS
jgi:2-oxoglutarate ferredoxin oxidoreductase subunit alpha